MCLYKYIYSLIFVYMAYNIVLNILYNHNKLVCNYSRNYIFLFIVSFFDVFAITFPVLDNYDFNERFIGTDLKGKKIIIKNK